MGVLEYVPETSLLVSVPDERVLEGFDAAVADRLRAGEKVSPLLASGAPGGGRLAAEAIRPAAFIVAFHRDVPAGEARSLIADYDLRVQEHLDLLPNELLIQGATQDAKLLAEWDEVAYVYPASEELALGRGVHACAGAVTAYGPVGHMTARIGEGWDGAGRGAAQLGFYLGTLAAGLPRVEVQAELFRAMAEWSRHVRVDFAAAAAPGLPRTLAFLFAKGGHGDGFAFDGRGRVLAHTFYPAPPNPETIAGDLHFDDDEAWGLDSGIDVYSVALHELGHALGLGHSDRPGAVMYPYYSRLAALTQEDIEAIRELYAARETAPQPPVQPPVQPPAAPPAKPPAAPPAPPSNPQPPRADTTAPALIVTSPAAASSYTFSDSIVLRGMAQDLGGVVEVSWADSIGNTGLAQGTSNWVTAPIPLRVGSNTITVRARDAAGNSGWRTVVVTRRRR